MLYALDGQHAGQVQLVHLPGKERNGLKAGFTLGGAARKSSVVAQAVILRQIAKRETVAEQDGLTGRSIHGSLIVRVKSGQLFDISGSIRSIGILIVGVDLLQHGGNCAAKRLGVFQREPDMLVVLRFFLVVVFFCIVMLIGIFVVMVVFLFLHALDHFFGFNALAKSFQQVDDLHVLVGGIFQSIVHPVIRLAANIDEQVALGDFDDIIRGGLIAVQVNAIIQQHGHFGVIRLVTENFSDPIVFGKNRGDNAQSRFIRSRRLILLAAACQQTNGHYQRKAQGNYSFHG